MTITAEYQARMEEWPKGHSSHETKQQETAKLGVSGTEFPMMQAKLFSRYKRKHVGG